MAKQLQRQCENRNLAIDLIKTGRDKGVKRLRTKANSDVDTTANSDIGVSIASGFNIGFKGNTTYSSHASLEIEIEYK